VVNICEGVRSKSCLANVTTRSNAAPKPRVIKRRRRDCFGEAFGIVVQEAMAIGLSTICLDWGGPRLLIKNGISGFLVKPISEDYIVTTIAELMDRLAIDDNLAESFSFEARKSAQGWRWSKIIEGWLSLYSQRVLVANSAEPAFTDAQKSDGVGGVGRANARLHSQSSSNTYP
jgi:hypothetical protein